MTAARNEAKEPQYRRITAKEAFYETSVKISPHYRLAFAVDTNDEKKALAALQEGANANALMMADKEIDTLDEPEEFLVTHEVTFLQKAVWNLNFNITLLLLQHGADPNMPSSRNESTLELFRSATLLWQLSATNSAIPRTSSRDDWENKILDLLLCYGMNPFPNYTKSFVNSFQKMELGIEFNMMHTTGASRQAPLIKTEIKFEEEKECSALTKKLYKTKAQAQIFFQRFNRKTPTQCQNIRYLAHHLNNYSTEIKQTVETIAKERLALMESYASPIKEESPLFPPLIVLILQYAFKSIEINQKVFDARQAQGRTIHFWQPEPAKSKQQQEEEKRHQTQRLEIYLRVEKYLDQPFKNTQGKRDNADIAF